MNIEKKSPLKSAPLRSAGQSIQDRQIELLNDKLVAPAFLIAFFLGITLFEWLRTLRPTDPNPALYSLLLLLSVGFFVYRLLTLRSELMRLRLAKEGERAVGQLLDTLRADGYQVFHDVLGEGFNLVHVLIGPGGVFTVETKTWSKPARGSPEVLFDGEAIRVGGLEPDRNPVIQARAQAGWLRSVLSESTGREFAVLPVVVFPGWFVKTTTRPRQPLWVLEPKALVKYLKNREPQLTAEEIALAGFHLSRFIRAEEARRTRDRR
jgi:hypothetical protein